MPEMDGYAVAATLQRLGYRGALIALTAHAMESERKRCLAAGFHEHLSKPVERVELVQTIVRSLTSIRAANAAATRAAS
jgi:CheY-like chemotaxis protein